VKVRVAVLLVLGLLQMTGDLLRIPWVRSLGAASGASPAPKVFCAVKGYEAYSTRFAIEWLDANDEIHSRPLGADSAGRLLGPYNRRNVYGAALAFGPVLPEGLRDPVLKYALSGEAPILRELGIDPRGVRRVWVRYDPLPGVDLGSLPRLLEPETP
jgi:hypothetical protein